ncbi:hypothetical protein I3842_10G163900 [Carya illinoinensis]|uniref:Uncharacterized protein n=1 Tax=Carya illinoinensis TaxID=32201 RepID=A0A922E0Y7_CARIL|nr:hypothetical protein I3842_10G163900 [Carya illinoinensis]
MDKKCSLRYFESPCFQKFVSILLFPSVVCFGPGGGDKFATHRV